MKKQIFKLSFLLILLAGILQFTPARADDASSTTSTIPAVPAAPVATTNLFVRYQDQIIYNGNINLTSTTYHDAINNIDYALNTSTVFSALVSADQQSDAFNISDAQFNQTYNSFYVACLNITTSSAENACYNWNYVVNGALPFVGMDAYNLTGGETIYAYFSAPWQITATSSTLPVETTTTLETWHYQYDNLSEPWIFDANDSVEISTAGATVTTTQTDANGLADYIFSATGTFSAKIVSADWSKWSNPITINVTDAPVLITTSTDTSTSTDTNTTTNSGSGSGGGGGTPPNPPASADVSQSAINNSVQAILNFLKAKQTADGSINEDLGLSDWTTMAFGADGIYANTIQTGTTSLFDYIYNADVSQATDPLNICTGYSRHILGLLAAGAPKNDIKITSIKNKINGECFSNEKIGQDGTNDDVFVLLAELATDEPATNSIIQTAINTITADQQSSGAFTWNGWPGQDITGASVNALKYAQAHGATIDETIFQKAAAYLKSTQLADGGWGFSTSSDALTTSWAISGINALGQGQTDWTNGQNKNPWSVLTAQLNGNNYYQSPYSADGIDWFATKHAVPALLGASWPIILTPIVLPATGSQSSPQLPAATSTAEIVTTTIEIPTTTVAIATTTDIVSSALAVAPVVAEPAVAPVITKPHPHKTAILKPTTAPALIIKSGPPIQNTTTITEKLINQAPIDLASKNLAKKILAISGGGALGIGLLIGLGFLKNMI